MTGRLTKGRIQLLDGAMGTQLESLGYDVSGPMWGSDLLHSDPSAIQRVHDGYAEAGANLIETATYQMTLGPLLSTHTHNVAEGIMQGAISLVATSCSKSSAAVVLSLGPYGATLSPSQEYAGIYPPPYGPSSSPGSGSSSALKSNAFPPTKSGGTEEEGAVEALAEWHLSRLRVYATDEEAWTRVEWLAFETVPLTSEIRGIRRALGRLNRELRRRYAAEEQTKSGGGVSEGGSEKRREWWNKKFWITSAYPDGHHPQHHPTSGGHISTGDVLSALLDGEADGTAVPDGLGVNCTNPTYIARITRELTEAMRQRLGASSGDVERGGVGSAPPVFVLYPDGGAVYDTTTRTWAGPSTQPDEWAVGVAGIARDLERAELEGDGTSGQGRGVWGGVIVGGCCKAGFEEIRSLRRELDA